MNGALVFLAFLVFVLFAYLSLVRVLHKLAFDRHSPGVNDWWRAILDLGASGAQVRTLLISVIIYVIPAVALSLFWGWGPALLWLVISHLLIETPVALLLAWQSRVDVPENNNQARSAIRWLLIQWALIMLLAFAVTTLVELLQPRSGLIFCILTVIITTRIWQPTSGLGDWAIKLLAGLAVLASGFLISQVMTIEINGEWSPVHEWLPWFQINQHNLFAGLAVVVCLILSAVQEIRDGVANFAATAMVGLILLMLVLLVIQQPTLPVPLLTYETTAMELPSILWVCFLLFTTPILVFAQLANFQPAESPSRGFLRQQVMGVLVLLLSVSWCLWLVSDLTWVDHFYKGSSIIVPVSGVLQSFTKLFAGAEHTVHTLLSLIAFSTAILLLVQIRSQAGRRKEILPWARINHLLDKGRLQSALAFVLCCWLLSSGLVLDYWILMLSVCWLVAADAVLRRVAWLQGSKTVFQLFRGLALLFALVGVLQLVFLSVLALFSGHYFRAIPLLALVCLALVLFWSNWITCLQQIRARNPQQLFSEAE